MKNNEITIKAVKNGLLPTVDAYAFYGGSCAGRCAESCALVLELGNIDSLPSWHGADDWIRGRSSEHLQQHVPG